MRLKRVLERYGISVALVSLATLVGFPVHFYIDPTNLVMLYLAAVMVAAVYLGLGPAILASLLGVLMFDYFFVQPRLSFSVADTQYLLTFFGLLAVGIIISSTAAQLRDRVEQLRQREAQATALNSLSQELTGAAGLRQVASAVLAHVQRSLDSDAALLVLQEGQLALQAATPGFSLQKEDWAAAQEALTRKRPVNRDFLPLLAASGAVGVIVVRPHISEPELAPAQRQLVEGFANLAALALERVYLAEQARQIDVLAAKEKLQTALLNSISHELRTPLAVITGSLSSLLDQPNGSPLAAAQTELLETAYEEARRLNLLVGNLLDMSRLEAGALRLKRAACDLQDLVGIALERTLGRSAERPVQTSFPDGLPLVDVDEALFLQVIVNLLDNALKYSPAGSPLAIQAWADQQAVYLEVRDQGPGLAASDLERVFDKFYRSHPGAAGGTGLGLTICRGIVEAHGGQIHASNHPAGGARFTVTLPRP